MKKPVKGAVLAAMTLAMTTGFTIPSSSETITNSRREEVISEMMNDPDFKSMYKCITVIIEAQWRESSTIC